MRGLIILFIIFIANICSGQLACSFQPYVLPGVEESYIEVYLGIQSGSLMYDEGKANLQYILMVHNDTETHFLDKFAFDFDEKNKNFNVWDVKRIAVIEGDWILKSKIIDTNANDTLTFDIKCAVHPPNKPVLSRPILCVIGTADQLLPFEKFGLHYEKLAFDLIVSDDEDISFLSELKNVDAFGLESVLLRFDMCQGLYNPSMPSTPLSSGYIKKDASPFHFITKKIETRNLPNGDYHLLTTIIDKDKNELLRSFSNFQIYRQEKYTLDTSQVNKEFEKAWVQTLSYDDLDYAIKAIKPQLSGQQSEILNTLLFNKNVVEMKYFLYSYWSNYSPSYPEQAFEKYMEVAKVVDRQFDNNIGYGFETDRGFYFLKYGKPDVVIDEDQEPSAPPYEVWIYNSLHTGETNIKFLFYNPSLAHNDYKILHSNSRFDIRNPDWQRVLYFNSPNEVNGTPIRGTVGDNNYRRAVMIFNDF